MYDVYCLLHPRADRARLRIKWDWLVQRKEFREIYVSLHKRKQYVQWLPPLDEEEEVRALSSRTFDPPPPSPPL